MPTSRADVPEHQILRWKPVRSTEKRDGGRNSEVLHRMPLLENSGWMSRNQIFISVHNRREGRQNHLRDQNSRERRTRNLPQVRTFSFMNLRQPRFAPRLDDHYIAASIDELCNRGTLVRLPEAQIGGGYSHARCQPAEPMSQSIRYFGGSPSEARKRETEAEIARCCIECHFWKIVDGCPGTRYSFQSTTEEREDRTIYGTKIVENDEPGTCHRCWEEQ